MDDHMAVWDAEDTRPGKWEIWCNALEKLIGHDLDGSQVRDGFSLDHTFKMWMDGLTIQAARDVIEHNKAIVAMAREWES